MFDIEGPIMRLIKQILNSRIKSNEANSTNKNFQHENFLSLPIHEFLPNFKSDGLLRVLYLGDQAPTAYIEARKSRLGKNMSWNNRWSSREQQIGKAIEYQDHALVFIRNKIDGLIDIVRDADSDEKRAVEARVNYCFDRWQWELHFFLKFDYLHAKRDLWWYLEYVFDEPLGLETSEGDAQSLSNSTSFNNTIFTYLTALIAKKKLERHKSEFLRLYQWYGYEDRVRAKVLTPELEKEIVKSFEV